MSYKGGELYLIREVDLRTGKELPFVKIGIVRDSESRSTDQRVKEHQTGNPRYLKTHLVVRTPLVEMIETTLHGRFAPLRVSGEWFHLDDPQLSEVQRTTKSLVTQAKKKSDFLETAEALKGKPSKEVLQRPSKETTQLHRELGLLKANLKACEDGTKRLKQFFEELFKRGDEVSDFYTVTSKASAPDFDEAAFKAKHPGLWKKFQVTKDRPIQRFIVADLNAFKKDAAFLKPEVNSLVSEINSVSSGKPIGKSGLSRIHGLYLNLLSLQVPLEWESTLTEAQLKVACGVASGIDGICTWNRKMETHTTFDKTAVKKAHPDKWELFTIPKPNSKSTELRRDRNYRI